jgi:hypothetical protein
VRGGEEAGSGRVRGAELSPARPRRFVVGGRPPRTAGATPWRPCALLRGWRVSGQMDSSRCGRWRENAVSYRHGEYTLAALPRLARSSSSPKPWDWHLSLSLSAVSLLSLGHACG